MVRIMTAYTILNELCLLSQFLSLTFVFIYFSKSCWLLNLQHPGAQEGEEQGRGAVQEGEGELRVLWTGQDASSARSHHLAAWQSFHSEVRKLKRRKNILFKFSDRQQLFCRLTIAYLRLREFAAHGDPPWNRDGRFDGKPTLKGS